MQKNISILANSVCEREREEMMHNNTGHDYEINSMKNILSYEWNWDEKNEWKETPEKNPTKMPFWIGLVIN